MTFPDEAAIERIAHGVIDRTLPKHDWTHAGHFAAALWLCRHRRDLTGADEIRRLISRYNEATNTPNTDTGGYHHTITLASLRAATFWLERYPPDAPLSSILKALMASDAGDSGWLLACWRHETLFSVRARRHWIDPDLAPLPF